MMRTTACAPAVLGFLEKHRIETLNIAGILENEPQVEVFVDDESDPEGLLVKGPWFWYVHTEDEAFLEGLFSEMIQRGGFYQFSGVWRPIAERIQSRFPVVWSHPCDLYHLPPENQVPPLEDSQAKAVDLQDAETIDRHYAYRHSRSLEKIRNCIRNRPSSAIYAGGEIVCWLLVHEDNSLGIMYTLEEHRRKGYALDVSLDLVAKQLAAGKTPFLQIRDGNAMSPGLARKCGFVPHGQCDWFGVIVGTPRELVEGGVAFRKRVLESFLPEERMIQRAGFRVLLSGNDVVLEPEFESQDAERSLAEVRELTASSSAPPLWIVTPLDNGEAVKTLVESGRLQPEREVSGLYRFLYLLQPDPSTENPVVEIPEEEWLAFAARCFEGAPLKSSIARLGKDLRLLGERRAGAVHAVAALLVDDDDGFELLGYSSREEAFLQRVLERARTMKLGAAFVHAGAEERAAFENLGFALAYTEMQYRMKR